MSRRRRPPIHVIRQVLHESGYRCSNPVCRNFITLELHHIVPVAKDGRDDPSNLIALCPTCHEMYHKGMISEESIKDWKLIQLTLNEALDRKSLELLLTLAKLKELYLSGDGVLQCAGIIANDLAKCRLYCGGQVQGAFLVTYHIEITDKGRSLVEAWMKGDQAALVTLMGTKER